MKLSLVLTLLLVFYGTILLQVNISNASDITEKNLKLIRTLKKKPKAKIHLHRMIMKYLEFDSQESYSYLLKMLQWNPDGFKSDPADHQDNLTPMQHLVLLDTIYNHGNFCAPDHDHIQSWFRFYSPTSLPLSEPIITFPFLCLPECSINKAYDFYEDKVCNFFFDKFQKKETGRKI
jgi:hypothetical protein